MVKVLIKKNIKPKTTKQKQKQKQTQTVNINIGDTITKKKRGRPTRRSKMEKQTTKPASQQPITQSYIQPIFKQSIPNQPSTLASSILASQNIPKVIKEEVKEESAIKKALIDQNLSTEEPEIKANDLERVREERRKKFEIPKGIKKEEPIRHALFSQMLSDQQDDTEEIQQLIKLSKPPTTPFDANELTPLKTVRYKQPTINPLVSFSPSIEPVLLSQENKEPDLFTALEETAEIPQSITDTNEETNFETPLKEKTILEPPETTTTILEPAKKEQPLITNQAEEQFTEIKSVDGPAPDVIDNALTTPPRYTKAQINRLRVIPIGEVITAEKVKDPEGRKLVFNGQRVFREGKLGQQINLPELRSILKSHYGFDD
jgi:hypothetical protein